jgi:hypothetical protein
VWGMKEAVPLACGSLGTGGGWPILIEDFLLLLGVEKVGAEAASAGSARVVELGAPSAPPLVAAAKVRGGFWLLEAGGRRPSRGRAKQKGCAAQGRVGGRLFDTAGLLHAGADWGNNGR